MFFYNNLKNLLEDNASSKVCVVSSLVIFGGLSSANASFFMADFNTADDGTSLVAGDGSGLASTAYDEVFGIGTGLGITFTSDTSGLPLNLYNSDGVGGEDDDLERVVPGTRTTWDGGNAQNSIFGNLLIVNESTDLTIPDDNGANGAFTLVFDLALTDFGFDFVDLDNDGSIVDNSTITFIDSTLLAGSNSITISFRDIEDTYTTDAVFDNAHANAVDLISASDLTTNDTSGVVLTQFDTIEFSLDGSGGLAGISGNTVPEPGSAFLMLLGGATLLSRRSRKLQH